MGKVIVSTQMTIDGVIDQTDAGWYIPEGEHNERGLEQLHSADAMLLGRKTYEGLAAVWPDMDDVPGWGKRTNAMPKFVASRTLQEPLEWNATLIEGDVAERVAELRDQHSGDLVSYGCGEFAHYLATHGLVDEVRFWVHPVVWGSGERPFGGRGPVAMRATGATMFSSGVALLCYEPD